jgi:hypothetical protein
MRTSRFLSACVAGILILSAAHLCALGEQSLSQDKMAQQQKNPEGSNINNSTVNNDASVGVAAAADSTQRFKLWLSTQQLTSNDHSGQTYSVAQALGVDVGAALHAMNMPDWQIHLIWSWGDQGPCEGSVQSYIQNLDAEYGTKMFLTCIWPGGLIGQGGRACIMQRYACDAAKNGFDERALRMTIATQQHNEGAANSLRAAGATNVADFIRNNRGCR